MALQIATDLDFLAANVHGRRSRLAEAERLDELCRIRTLPDLARALLPESQPPGVAPLQRALVRECAADLSAVASRLGGACGRFLHWLRMRFAMENVKVLVRGFSSGIALPDLQPHLVPLPADLTLDTEALAGADSIEAFAAAVNVRPLRAGLERAIDLYRRRPRPFFAETGLDFGYLTELLARARALPWPHRGDVLPIARQEAGLFHLALVSRGRFTYGLEEEMLRPFHVYGGLITRNRFRRMLAAPTLAEAASLAVGTVIDTLPEGDEPDPAALEILAWNRHYHLTNRMFRRSHMGLGAVVAYTVMRRVELANLITLTEGVRAHLPPDVLRRRLIPLAHPSDAWTRSRGAAHV